MWDHPEKNTLKARPIVLFNNNNYNTILGYAYMGVSLTFKSIVFFMT